MRPAQWLLALLLLVESASLHAQAPSALVVDVSLNGAARGTVLLLEEDSVLFLAQEDARTWRLRVPAQSELMFRGQAFNSLSALGLTVTRLDRAAQQIDLRADPSSFDASMTVLSAVEYRLTPAAWGGFATYDLIGTRINGRSAVDGAFTLSAFTPHGSLSHQFVERDLWSDDRAQRESIRIGTTYRRDWPESLASLEVGDTVSRPGAFGSALRYGGINVGSNFGLRPGFIRQPLPELSGEASLPSTVQVFVQNQLRSVTQVPAGPFTLNDVPVISGAGDARVVVRDALGRETVVTSTFYVAGGLLRRGLAEWNLGAGKLRDDDTGDANYSQGYGTALLRYGVSDALTIEGRAEYEAERTRVVGGAVDFGGLWGEVELTSGLAQVQGIGRRWLAGAGYRYVTLDYSFGVRWVESQRGFVQPGDTVLDSTPKRTISATGGALIVPRLSAGLAWLGIERHFGPPSRSFNASATWSLDRGASLLFAYNRVSEAGIARNIASVILSMSVDFETTLSAGVDGGSERRQFASIQRALPFDEGWGYRASLNHFSRRTRADAAAGLNLPAATVTAEIVDESQQRAAGRIGIAGSLALIEDKAFLARQITDSFALVRVPGVPDAPIFLNNHPAGATDEDGRLVLPRMTAYVPNEIRVDIDGLPPDAEIVRDRETAVPPLRSGVVVTLGIRRTAAALVKAVDAEGRPLGIGAAVEIQPEGSATSVAQGGAFFIRAEPGRKRATITERGVRCVIDFDLLAADVGAYRTLGPYTCAR